MKTLLSLVLLAVSFLTFASEVPPTRVIANRIDYGFLVAAAKPQAGVVDMAAIGGTVTFEGTGPVYVTLRIGGQDYTALTDAAGRYSFWAYANSSSRFGVEAWTIPGSQPGTAQAGTTVKADGDLSTPQYR